MTEMAPRFADAAFSQALYQVVGQTDIKTWDLVGNLGELQWPDYDWLRSHEPELVLLRIKQLVGTFPTWQHRAMTGRPPFDFAIILLAVLVRGFMRTTFAETESYLRVLAPYFELGKVPDKNTISRWNRDRRFRRTLRRFLAFILSEFSGKDLTIALDSTGFSPSMRSWRMTPYDERCRRRNRKTHLSMDTASGLVLSSVVTRSNLHDSGAYAAVIDAIPDWFGVRRTLADGAYSGTTNLDAADARGISPIHTVRKDAVWKRTPSTRFQRLVRFARTFPNRFAELIGPRALVETTMSSIKMRTGGRLRCRHPIAIENEIQVKIIVHDIRRTIKPVLASN